MSSASAITGGLFRLNPEDTRLGEEAAAFKNITRYMMGLGSLRVLYVSRPRPVTAPHPVPGGCQLGG